MALSTRQKMFFFVGLNIAMYGLALLVLGAWLLDKTFHGASGASMWCGIILIMCGVGNVIVSIDTDDEEKGNAGGVSICGMLANLIAMIVGIGVIGLATWGAGDELERGITYGRLGTEATIEIYVTVVLLGGFAMLLSVVALMFECCCSGGFDMLGGGMSPEEGFPANAGVYPQMAGQVPYPQGYQ